MQKHVNLNGEKMNLMYYLVLFFRKMPWVVGQDFFKL